MNIEEERVIANLKDQITHGADRKFLMKVKDISSRELRRQCELQIERIRQKLDLLIEEQDSKTKQEGEVNNE